jgi:hypothetical protein
MTVAGQLYFLLLIEETTHTYLPLAFLRAIVSLLLRQLLPAVNMLMCFKKTSGQHFFTFDNEIMN